MRSAGAYPFSIEEYAKAAKEGGWGDLAALKMMDAGAQHIIEASEDVGADSTLSHTAQSLWRKAITETEATGTPDSMFRIMGGGQN